MIVRLPITVFFDGQYQPPGTALDLPDDEAARLIDVHGEIDDGVVLSNEDFASIDALNKHNKIHGGHGQ